MGAFDKCNAAGWYDPAEPPLTDDELGDALDWRQAHVHYGAGRADSCPHPRPCASVADCVEKIAWYRRHQRTIETAITAGRVAGYVLA